MLDTAAALNYSNHRTHHTHIHTHKHGHGFIVEGQQLTRIVTVARAAIRFCFCVNLSTNTVGVLVSVLLVSVLLLLLSCARFLYTALRTTMHANCITLQVQTRTDISHGKKTCIYVCITIVDIVLMKLPLTVANTTTELNTQALTVLS
jgi:hypothetical protein